MRKELVISSYDSLGNPYYSGGGAIAIHEVAKRLSSEFKVTIIAGNHPKTKERFVDGVNYQYIGVKFFGPKVGQLFYHFALLLTVVTKKHDIWVENFTPPFSTSFLPFFTRKPVVGLVHMLTGEDMKRKFKFPFDKIEKFGLKFYRYFIVLSKNNKDIIKGINKNAKFLLTKNGVSKPNNLLPYNKRRKKHLLFIGRVEVDQKGLDTLVSAYHTVKDKVNLPLIIAGSGEQNEMSKLKKIINDYNMQEKIKLVGRVDGIEKDKLLKHASLVIIPSRYETFSISALEAISYNVPLISGDIPGMKWIPKKNNLKFTPGSVERLADKITKLYSDQKLCQKLSVSQQSTVKKYDWKQIATEYSQFINSI